MKRIYLPLLLILLVFDAKSQSLLGLSKAQIKKSIKARHGVIKSDNFYSAGIIGPPHSELFCSFPEVIASKDDIHFIIFYLSKNDKCYKYVTTYGSDKSLRALINNFNNPNSELKKVDKDLKWVNASRGYEMEIIPGKMKSGQKTSIFILDTHLIK